MGYDAQKDVLADGNEAQRAVDGARRQGAELGQQVLRERRELDHALGHGALAGGGAGPGRGDGSQGTIEDGLVGSGAMAEYQGMGGCRDGNCPMGIITDEELARLVFRRRREPTPNTRQRWIHAC